MKIVAHQPQFLPWPGFWAKYAQADKVVLMPNVQWDKGQVSNRVKIDSQWLTLPVHVPESNWLLDVTYTERDLRKVIKTFELTLMSKRTNPYWERLEPVREQLTKGLTASPRLVHLNADLIRVLAGVLGLKADLVFDPDTLTGKTTTSRLHQFLTRNLGSTTVAEGVEYLSGAGGREYLKELPGMTTTYVEGRWEDCSIVQLIARHPDPMSMVMSGLRQQGEHR